MCSILSHQLSVLLVEMSHRQILLIVSQIKDGFLEKEAPLCTIKQAVFL